MTLRTTIERLGHRGDGIAPGPLFVPLALPGEVVEGVEDGNLLRDVMIIEPSPHRVRPPCRHFTKCGGCALQHASDDFVAEWKLDVVRRALAAQGLEAELRMAAVSPAASRRRAALSGRRTKKSAVVGLHERASDSIVEIAGCGLLHPDLIAVLPALRELTRLGASRKAELSLAITRSLGGVDVAVGGGKPLDADLRARLADLARAHDLARLSWGDEVVVTRRAPAQRMGSVEVVPPPGAFLQATEEGQDALVTAVQKIVLPAKRILDLFAGCGTFALPLAEFSEVYAVEGDKPMLQALDAGWRRTSGLKRVATQTRDLFRQPVLADDLDNFDAAVIDPPRAGAEAQTLELARSGVAKIAYVSCNPVTFARDAEKLVRSGYGLERVEIVDQFRWSSHIEMVGAFKR